MSVFHHTFAGVSVPNSIVVVGLYVQSRAYLRKLAGGPIYAVYSPATALLMFSHSLYIVNMWMSRKCSVKSSGGEKLFTYGRSNIIRSVVKTILRAYSALTRSVSAVTTGMGLGSMGASMHRYVLYNHSEGTLALLESLEDGFSVEWDREDFLDAEDADSTARQCTGWLRGCGLELRCRRGKGFAIG